MMMLAPLPANEPERLNELYQLKVLDTDDDPLFEKFVHLAAAIMDTPIALVSLVDFNRQWFKAKIGTAVCETPRDISFCGHAIMSSKPLIVENALLDDRFKDNPMVVGYPKIRFYAGIPLVTKRGYRVGTLCVIDTESRSPTALQLNQLKILSSVVSDALTMQRDFKEAELKLEETQTLSQSNSLFLANCRHEMRTPLHQIIGLLDLLEEDGTPRLDEHKRRHYLSVIQQNTQNLYRVVDGIVHLGHAITGADLHIESVIINDAFDRVMRTYMSVATPKHQKLIFHRSKINVRAFIDKKGLQNIADALIANAIQYGREESTITITVSVDPKESRCLLAVRDNGPGLEEDVLARVHDPYGKTPNFTLQKNDSGGFSLMIVKQLANSMKCDFEIHNVAEGGTLAILKMPLDEASIQS